MCFSASAYFCLTSEIKQIAVEKIFLIITIWLATLKHDETVLYLVRETKETKDFEKLCNAEADKICCGRKHFEKFDVNYDVYDIIFDVLLIVPNKKLVRKHLL